MEGRSVCVVSDLSISEQRKLYSTAAEIKRSIHDGQFPANDNGRCAYLMFLEDSTRTKESFRNAAATLDYRVNMFDATHSSISKSETLNDTVRMLCGYTPSMGSVFVIRSKTEGLCRSLADSMSEYANRVGLVPPSFINAGDGRHEHPTQEFLDEFTFLEQLGNRTDEIHIALIGDLLLGRTIHSKADGLCIFSKVTVDLIAPPELQLPAQYINKMKKNGFSLNFFGSLDEYFASPSQVAPILYFTRLQLERMDKSLLEKETQLRSATSLRMDMLPKLPKGAKIYHPLPRHGETPEIPFEVDKTEFNGYDEQSRNGYFVRTALMQLVTPNPQISRVSQIAQVPRAFHTEEMEAHDVNPMFKFLATTNANHDEAWIDIQLPQGKPSDVRKAITKMRVLSNTDILDGSCQVVGTRGTHTIPISLLRDKKWLEFFFAYFSGCQAKIVYQHSNHTLMQITAPEAPERVKGLKGLACLNSACVSHPDMKQRDVQPVFERIDNTVYKCRYCDKETTGRDMFVC